MKLKQTPRDFIVDEIPSIAFSSEKQSHAVYLLEKQELDTFDALRFCAKKLHVPLFEIGYAGLKDKHALTRQYVSFPAHHIIPQVSSENLRLTFVGYHQKKIKTGDLKGNRFSITVRDIKQSELDGIEKRAQMIPLFGVPNYFDSQRFGSAIDNEFIIKHVMAKNYEQAVKIFLTKYLKSERKNIKDEKRKIFAQWNTLGDVMVRTRDLMQVITEYKKTGSWLAAYRKIPAHLREMYVNAYQSFLWNECVKEVLKTVVDKKRLHPVEYAVGSLFFFHTLQDSEQRQIPDSFPTVSATVALSEFEEDIVQRVIDKQGISLFDLNIEEATGNFFKARQRQILVIPEDFSVSQSQKDELNDKKDEPRYKMIISFGLPQGSYATVLTKQLFGH